MTMRLTLLAAIAAALVAPSAATAGGWATVGFDPPPEDLAPGEPWQVDLTVLQHGITPLEGVTPRVIVSRRDGGEEASFRAHPTDEPGVYRASVVFETAGEWSLVVDDGFAARHTFRAVQVGNGGERAAEQVAAVNTAAAAPPSAGEDGPNVLLALGAAAVAALAAGFGAAYLQRRAGGPSAAGG
jgi:YtkA-like